VLDETQHPVQLLAHRLSAGTALGSAEIDALLAIAGHPRTLPRGGEILVERTRSKSIWLLGRGWAFRQKSLGDGRRQIISLMLPGELSEKPPLLPFGAGHSIVAATGVELIPFDRAAFGRVTVQYPRLAHALFNDELIRNAVAMEWLLSLGRRSSEERLAYFLYETNLRLRAGGLIDSDRFELPLVQGDVADIMGLSAVHLNRTIRALRARGLIEWSDYTVHLLDPARLASFAHFNPELEGFARTIFPGPRPPAE
jgi:CRP-like cAMP-binding protein